MMKKPNWATPTWVASAALLLTACSGPLSQLRDGQSDHPVWPQPQRARPVVKAWFKPNPENLRKVQPGLSKRDVYALIGAPMHSEGFVGVHEWNYLFTLKGFDGHGMQCQYKVLFDKRMRSSQTMWNSQACSDLLNPSPVAAVPPPTSTQTHWIDIGADALFAFDTSMLGAEATSIVESRIVSALEAAEEVDSIKIVGHADELGSESYNMRLSLHRAEAVKAYLVSQGVPAAAIATEGRGNADPLVKCSEVKRDAQIVCLAPNRRVRIEIVVSNPVSTHPASAPSGSDAAEKNPPAAGG